jgi:hypothetical protein
MWRTIVPAINVTVPVPAAGATHRNTGCSNKNIQLRETARPKIVYTGADRCLQHVVAATLHVIRPYTHVQWNSERATHICCTVEAEVAVEVPPQPVFGANPAGIEVKVPTWTPAELTAYITRPFNLEPVELVSATV